MYIQMQLYGFWGFGRMGLPTTRGNERGVFPTQLPFHYVVIVFLHLCLGSVALSDSDRQTFPSVAEVPNMHMLESSVLDTGLYVNMTFDCQFNNNRQVC